MATIESLQGNVAVQCVGCGKFRYVHNTQVTWSDFDMDFFWTGQCDGCGGRCKAVNTELVEKLTEKDEENATDFWNFYQDRHGS